MDNPYYNAILASGYIVAIVVGIWSTQYLHLPETILAPILMLSLLVLSVSVMGFLFFLRPFQMYLDGHRSEAVIFFAKEVLTFAGITAAIALVTLL